MIPSPLCRTFAVSLLALAACSESRAPTAPGAAAVAAPSFALASNTWTKRAPVPNNGPRMFVSAGVADNAAGQATLYIFGGNFGQVSWDDIEAYNYVTNTWTLRGRFPESRRSATNGVGKIGNQLFISGGYAPSSSGTDFGYGAIQKTLYAYDPVANRMIRKADMPRTGADGATGVINGKLYVLASTCGYDCSERLIRRLYRYDPATNVWTGLVWCPRFHIYGAGGAINGKFYVVGGNTPFIGPNADLDVYDPITNKWKALAPMPDARTHAAAAVVDNVLYVVGGLGKDAYDKVTSTGGSHLPATGMATAVCLGACGRRSVFAYNPATNTWSTKASMPTARHGLATAPLPFDGQSHFIAVGGSQSEFDSDPSANEVYTR